jgi:7-carboxy-7-deazaguanine synthase
MIPVMECFSSIQGEGSRAGVGSIFLRTALCNFQCPGFKVEYPDPKDPTKVKYGCDSFYSVDPGYKKEWDYLQGYEEIIDVIDAQIPKYSRHNLFKPDIVLTGGEPLIYWKDEDYQKMLAHYVTRCHKITIETNASIDIDFARKYQKEIAFSMSVKLDNSGELESKRINIKNITNILENTEGSYLKFVVNEENWEKDFVEIKNLLKSTPTYVENIYLMPMGDTIETLEKNAKFVFERAMELGFHYSDRLHIRIFDNRAGV